MKTLIGISATLFFAACSKDTGSQILEEFRSTVRAHHHALTNYSNDLLSGKVNKVSPFEYYQPPDCTQNSFFAATFDSNSNVYFVSRQSFTTFNVGIVYSKDGKPLLGDGLEPTIVTNIPIAQSWHYYKAR